MKRALLAALLCVAALAATARTAAAEEASMAGKLGLGFDATLSGAAGLTARYWILPKLSLGAVISYDQTSNDGNSVSEFDLGLRGLYAIIQDGSFDLDVGGGISIIRNAVSTDAGDDSSTDFAIDLGLGPTWWVTDHFALNLFFGLVFDTSNADGGGDGTFVSLLKETQVVGQAGFIWLIN